MSVNDRRAASYMSAPRPRVVSNRNSDPEKAAALRSGVPPLQPDNNIDYMRGSTASHKSKMPRDQVSTSEKRTERSAVSTRERAQTRTRNSMQESGSAGNRGNLERSRSKRASSPNVRKKEKEPAEGQ